MIKLKSHPLAELFPAIPDKELKELGDHIKQFGLQFPIVLYDGRILDGRNRYFACNRVGVEPKTVEYEGNNPAEYVISANLKRRHLTTGQRADIAVKLANMTKGRPEIKSANLQIKQSEAAKSLGISTRSVATQAEITKANPALAKRVANGEISLNSAAKKVAEAARPVAKPEPAKDETGTKIPTDALPFWNRRQEIQDLLTEVSRLKCLMEKAKDVSKPDPMFAKVSNGIIDHFKAAYNLLLEAKPYAVCTQCQGAFSVRNQGCSMCGNKGLISQKQYEVESAQETKDIRRRANQLNP